MPHVKFEFAATPLTGLRNGALVAAAAEGFGKVLLHAVKGPATFWDDDVAPKTQRCELLFVWREKFSEGRVLLARGDGPAVCSEPFFLHEKHLAEKTVHPLLESFFKKVVTPALQQVAWVEALDKLFGPYAPGTASIEAHLEWLEAEKRAAEEARKVEEARKAALDAEEEAEDEREAEERFARRAAVVATETVRALLADEKVGTIPVDMPVPDVVVNNQIDFEPRPMRVQRDSAGRVTAIEPAGEQK